MNTQYESFRTCMIHMLTRRGIDYNKHTGSFSQDKLSKLLTGAFNELVSDLCDEIKRRELYNPNIKFLPPDDRYVEKRNQARKKLASLSDRRFEELACEVLRELEQRAYNSDTAQKGIGSANSKVTVSKPMQQLNSTYNLGTPDSSSQNYAVKRLANRQYTSDSKYSQPTNKPGFNSQLASATYTTGSSNKLDVDRKQKKIDLDSNFFNSNISLNDSISHRAGPSGSVSSNPNLHPGDVSSELEKQIKEKIQVLQSDMWDVKNENQKLKSLLKDLALKLNEKSDEISRISAQIKELKLESVKSKDIIKSLNDKVNTSIANSTTAKTASPAPQPDDASISNDRSSLNESRQNMNQAPSTYKDTQSLKKLSLKSNSKLPPSVSSKVALDDLYNSTENGEIIKSFLNVSNKLLDTAKSGESSQMLSMMKKFILELKEINSSSSQYEPYCEGPDQLDELHACQEYVMVSSGNLVEIVKDMSTSNEMPQSYGISEIESALEVTKSSVFLLAKLICQILANLYSSKDRSKPPDTKIVEYIKAWAIASDSQNDASEPNKSMPQPAEPSVDTADIKSFLEEKIASIVPLIKIIIEKIKSPAPDMQELGLTMDKIYGAFDGINTDVDMYRGALHPDIIDSVDDILKKMKETNKNFKDCCKCYMQDPSEPQLASEITNLCYEIAKQIKNLFTLF